MRAAAAAGGAHPRAQARYNISKTVRKRGIDALGGIQPDWYVDRAAEIAHEEEDSEKLVPPPEEAGAAPGAADLTQAEVLAAEKQYPLLLLNFYAPWCPWSQRMNPVWDAAARQLHARYPPQGDGRVLLAKVDCTRETELCRDAQIQGFPSVRVFRGGSDLVASNAALGGRGAEHATYVGDRTVDAIVAFVETLVPSQPARLALPAGNSAAFAAAAAAGLLGGAHPGCAIDGFVFVKKVPGAVVVSAQSESHSFVEGAMNMSHAVHAFYLGHRPSARDVHELGRLYPGGLPASWADKLAGGVFASAVEATTHEHYIQIVRTVVQPLRPRGARIDAYEYTAHSHSYEVENLPSARFAFAPSPMLVYVAEATRYGAYHFITTVSALIGGVFTVASIADSGMHAARRMLKKNQMGKNF